MGEVTLEINGQRHGGWKGVQITRSLEQLAHTFELSFVEQWSEHSQRIPIDEGAACRVLYGDESVISGYVDDSFIDYEAGACTMRVSGRSATGDLIDCAAQHAGGQWLEQPLSRIAEDLCRPYGLAVRFDAPVGDPFRRFALQDGETVHEALERAARLRGLLMVTAPNGALTFTRAGRVRTTTVIERGVNVIRGGRQGSMRDRFSRYIFKSQVAGDDEYNGKAAAGQRALALDPEVARHRPTIIHAEAQEAGVRLQARADWERNVRAGRARRLTYSLPSWECAEGLWAPNTLVTVRDPRLRVDGELLIVSVQLVRSPDEGTLTQLEITSPQAMTAEPTPPRRRRPTEWIPSAPPAGGMPLK